MARYRSAHPSGEIGTGPTHEPCEDYSKTGEFVEAVGGLFDLVRENPTASGLLSDGARSWVSLSHVRRPPRPNPWARGATLRFASGTGR
ncbi:hypothetical protein [Methanoculleus sp. UBA303]|uniref:hypothetical protein n=1 Tax=Methanoculleus sp. UBA303 TaxID=1915497 RepID=UPI0025D1B6D2|nr:hypothetical protein [Methanoculleus sp. UBA303]